jgi:hypothetical protein
MSKKVAAVRTGRSKQSVIGAAPAEHELPLRVTILGPPPGVQFCLQRGRRELVSQTVSTGRDISFDLSVKVKPLDGDGPPRFLGPFTQGPPAGRFIYVCSGTSAGQPDSPWSRRAKVGLTGITRSQIGEALKNPEAKLEARFHGTAADGGPSCATVRLLGEGWRLI